MLKSEILKKICYTELVYGRINKKLKINLSKVKIQKMIFQLIKNTSKQNFKKIGKNYYISNTKENVRVTVNSYTYRVITVDKIS